MVVLMKIYVINLLKATERRIFQEQQLQKLGLIDNVEFLKAVSVDDLQNVDTNLLMGWERPLRLAELACYQSHFYAWQRVLENQTPALILEDDALLTTDISEILNSLEKSQNYNYITLETRSRKKLLGKARPLTNNYSISRLYQDRTGAAAYILYPSGAKILIDKAKRTSPALADAFISSTYELNAYQIEPAAAIQIDQCETYNILSPIKIVSNISTSKKPKIVNLPMIKILKFKKKRIYTQFSFFVRQILLFSLAQKKFIKLSKSFNQQ